MGFAHYFYRPKSFEAQQFKAFVGDVRLFIEHLPNHSHSAGGDYAEHPVVIRGGMGKGQPQLTPNLVSFNGDDENGQGLAHETMRVPRILKPESWQQPDPEENNCYFQCCKTAGKPYDIVVCATLLSLKYHFPVVTVRSDGTPDDWFVAVAWYLDCVGRRPLGDGPWFEKQEGE